MSVLISLIIFGFSAYLFLITMRRLHQIENGVIDTKLKKEMEALLVEFNAAATRNITMLEDKIQELQSLIQKANQKIIQLDEKIERAQKPIVIEKVVEKPAPSPRNTPPQKEESLFASSPSTPKEKTLSRQEQLKQYLREGKSREDLLKMGFVENEINLVEFLSKKES